jgi:hypothetical protein
VKDPDKLGDIHVTPVNDLREHNDSRACWCNPTPDDDEPSIFIHHSMDGRENTIEKGITQ